MKLQRRRFLQSCAVIAALPFLPEAPTPTTWPSRIVKLDVGFPPGGGADAAARIVANGLSDRLGQQVIVENRPAPADASCSTASRTRRQTATP